ncbi:DUF721 domain-containing protein [bacterium]|nr:DUF721 domain-containing protein [bacterium]
MCNNANKNIVVRYSRPEHIKNVVSDVISRIKEKESKKKIVKIGEYIAKTLGEQSREHVEVSGLRRGSLYISVDSSAWLQELSLMKQDLANGINVKFKQDLALVKEIKIRLSNG